MTSSPRVGTLTLMSATSKRWDPALEFIESMPARYRQRFDVHEAREHADIVAHRAGAPGHAEIWHGLPKGGAVMCVVADDRPGLLSFISAALFAHMLDVVGAQVFTRRAADGPEAVDLFWLRRTRGGPIGTDDARGVTTLLASLITGELTVEELAGRPRAAANPRTSSGLATRVTFSSALGVGHTLLTVETHDRPGLLLAITRALAKARVQIVASEATTREGAVVDTFTLAELDSSPIRDDRMGLLRIEVLRAIDLVVRDDLADG
jgi:[protein-PII] uridylyltransferase